MPRNRRTKTPILLDEEALDKALKAKRERRRAKRQEPSSVKDDFEDLSFEKLSISSLEGGEEEEAIKKPSSIGRSSHLQQHPPNKPLNFYVWAPPTTYEYMKTTPTPTTPADERNKSSRPPVTRTSKRKSSKRHRNDVPRIVNAHIPSISSHSTATTMTLRTTPSVATLPIKTSPISTPPRQQPSLYSASARAKSEPPKSPKRPVNRKKRLRPPKSFVSNSKQEQQQQRATPSHVVSSQQDVNIIEEYYLMDEPESSHVIEEEEYEYAEESISPLHHPPSLVEEYVDETIVDESENIVDEVVIENEQPYLGTPGPIRDFSDDEEEEPPMPVAKPKRPSRVNAMASEMEAKKQEKALKPPPTPITSSKLAALRNLFVTEKKKPEVSKPPPITPSSKLSALRNAFETPPPTASETRTSIAKSKPPRGFLRLSDYNPPSIRKSKLSTKQRSNMEENPNSAPLPSPRRPPPDPESFQRTIVEFFYSTAMSNSELKPYFQNLSVVELQCEFKSLANMDKSQILEQSLRTTEVVETTPHYKLMQEGANMDLVIKLWQVAYESSWIDQDGHDELYLDPVQFIVGPSRAITNLRAMQKMFEARNHCERSSSSNRKSKSGETTDKKKGREGFLSRFWKKR